MDRHLDRGHDLCRTVDLPVHCAAAPEKAQLDRRPADAEPIGATALPRMESADEFRGRVGVEFDVRRQDDLEADEFAPDGALVSPLAHARDQGRGDRQTDEHENEAASQKQEWQERERWNGGWYGHRNSSFRRQDREWVDRDAALVDCEVQVRPRRDPSHAHVTYDLAGDDDVADLDRGRVLQMAVERHDVRKVLDLDHDGTARVSPGEYDLPGGHRPDRRAERSGDVDTGAEMRVALAPVYERRLERQRGRSKALGDRTREGPDDLDRHHIAVRPGHYLVWVCRVRVVGQERLMPVPGSPVVGEERRGRRDGVRRVADVRVGDAGEPRRLYESRG